MIERKVRVYVARAMTGRIKEEVVQEALVDKNFLENAGIEVLCPVSSEGVQATKEVLKSSKKAMDEYWPRDKAMIREADVVLNMSPDKPSLGVIREHGYARYCLWKKTISVFPKGKVPMKAAVCHYEDDFVTDDLFDAVGEIYRTHGTFFKRLKWRLKMLNRSLPKWLKHQIGEWK